MTKRIITETVADLSPYTFDGTLEDVRVKLDELIAEHGREARLSYDPYHWYQYDNNASPLYHLKQDRPETDDEQLARLDEEAGRVRAREAEERAQFEALSKKFGAR